MATCSGMIEEAYSVQESVCYALIGEEAISVDENAAVAVKDGGTKDDLLGLLGRV